MGNFTLEGIRLLHKLLELAFTELLRYQVVNILCKIAWFLRNISF